MATFFPFSAKSTSSTGANPTQLSIVLLAVDMDIHVLVRESFDILSTIIGCSLGPAGVL